MMRKYGADTIERLIPPADEVMLRRLRNLRKLENRKKRQREGQRDQSQDEEDTPIRGTSKTLDEILRDSDSDMEYLDEEEQKRPKGKKKAKNQAWIQDDPDNIVDLADVSASRKITATDPNQKKQVTEAKMKKKDGGFKTAADGRLVIADLSDDDEVVDNEPRPSGDIDTDTDDTDNEEAPSKSKLVKAGAKRRYDDILSIKSARSGRSRVSTASTAALSQYKAGGKGIHRPVGSSASAVSFGSEFKSKKAKGDIKKSGKHDPYAYLPLSRKNLNKRTKAQSTKQFRGIVKSKTKGVKVKKSKKQT